MRALGLLATTAALAALSGVLLHKGALSPPDTPIDLFVVGVMGPLVFVGAWAALLRIDGLEETRLRFRIAGWVLGVLLAFPFVAIWTSNGTMWWDLLFRTGLAGFVGFGVHVFAAPAFVVGWIALAVAHVRPSSSAVQAEARREALVGVVATVVAVNALGLLLVLPETFCWSGNGVETVGVVCVPHATIGAGPYGNATLAASFARSDRLALFGLHGVTGAAIALGLAAWRVARRRARANDE